MFLIVPWPESGLLTVPGFKGRVNDVYLLSNPKQHFAWKFDEDNLNIHAPSVIFDEINTVVVVKLKGKYEVTSNKPTLREGSILLPADYVDIHNPGYGQHAVVTGSGTESLITNWVDPRTRLEWMFATTEPGKYRVETLVRTAEGASLSFDLAGAKQTAVLLSTGDNYDLVELGEVEISEAGDLVISLQPDVQNWSDVELIYVELIKT